MIRSLHEKEIVLWKHHSEKCSIGRRNMSTAWRISSRISGTGATDDYSRLLTYHIARHKKSLSLLHSLLTPEELSRVRTTPLKTGEDDFLPERVFNSYYLVSESKPSEVIATAIDFLEVLVGFYEWLDDQFQGMPISKVLKELIEKEGKEIEKLRSIETESFFEKQDTK